MNSLAKEFNPAPAPVVARRLQDRGEEGTALPDLIRANQAIVAKKVTGNLFDRHIRRFSWAINVAKFSVSLGITYWWKLTLRL